MDAQKTPGEGRKVGSPVDHANPYASPRSPVGGEFSRGRGKPPVAEGSYGLGVFCGVVLGLWGLLGCHLLGKSETKRGSLHGFLGRLAGVVVVVVVSLVVIGIA